jgi:hypothetical protein
VTHERIAVGSNNFRSPIIYGCVRSGIGVTSSTDRPVLASRLGAYR